MKSTLFKRVIVTLCITSMLGTTLNAGFIKGFKNSFSKSTNFTQVFKALKDARSSKKAELGFNYNSSSSESSSGYSSKSGAYFHGGSAEFRFSRNKVDWSPWLDFQAPGISAGCGGFSMNLGFGQLMGLENIGEQLGQAAGMAIYGILIGIINSVPSIEAIFSKIKNWMHTLTNMLKNACQSSKALVDKYGPKKNLQELADKVDIVSGEYIDIIGKGLTLDPIAKKAKAVIEAGSKKVGWTAEGSNEQEQKVLSEQALLDLTEGFETTLSFMAYDIPRISDFINAEKPKETLVKIEEKTLWEYSPMNSDDKTLTFANLVASGEAADKLSDTEKEKDNAKREQYFKTLLQFNINGGNQAIPESKVNLYTQLYSAHDENQKKSTDDTQAALTAALKELDAAQGQLNNYKYTPTMSKETFYKIFNDGGTFEFIDVEIIGFAHYSTIQKKKRYQVYPIASGSSRKNVQIGWIGLKNIPCAVAKEVIDVEDNKDSRIVKNICGNATDVDFKQVQVFNIKKDDIKKAKNDYITYLKPNKKGDEVMERYIRDLAKSTQIQIIEQFQDMIGKGEESNNLLDSIGAKTSLKEKESLAETLDFNKAFESAKDKNQRDIVQTQILLNTLVNDIRKRETPSPKVSAPKDSATSSTSGTSTPTK